MKNKRILCFAVMCVILLCTVLCGCQNNKETSAANSSTTSETAKANIVYKDFSNQIHEKWNSSIADNQPEFLNLLDEKSSFKCISTEEIGDGYYVVNVSVSSPDISKSLKEYQEKVSGKKFSTDEMNKKLCELIDSAEMKTTNQKVDVIVDEEENVRVQFNDDFVNAMFGYAYIESMQAMMSEETGEQ